MNQVVAPTQLELRTQIWFIEPREVLGSSEARRIIRDYIVPALRQSGFDTADLESALEKLVPLNVVWNELDTFISAFTSRGIDALKDQDPTPETALVQLMRLLVGIRIHGE